MCCLVFVLALFGWKKIWFDRFGAEMPLYKTPQMQHNNKLFAQTKTLGIFAPMLYQLTKTLDMEYWTTHTGPDGYLYLLFQRRFLRLTVYLSLIAVLNSAYIHYMAKTGDSEISIDEVALKSKSLEYNQSWNLVLMVFLTSFFTLRAV